MRVFQDSAVARAMAAHQDSAAVPFGVAGSILGVAGSILGVAGNILGVGGGTHGKGWLRGGCGALS